MSVWLTIPSARPPAEAERCLSKWRAQGYKIALWRDKPHIDDAAFIANTALLMHGEYPGYAQAVNRLIAKVMKHYPGAEWFIAAGDDTEPDMNHTAEEIARQCGEHFEQMVHRSHDAVMDCPVELWKTGTFGVMQPTGDRFAEGSIDRIAGSAWLGREFCRRINQGKGPLWPEYVHNFVDEELQNVAIKYGIFWQRRDLIHLHRHFMRESDKLTSPAVKRETPEHLKAAFSPEGWGPYKAIFDRRKAQGFPGSEPIA